MSSSNGRAAARRWGRSVGTLGALALALTTIGCSIGGGTGSSQLSPPIRSGEPIGVQLMRAEPTFVGAPFRVLVDFESDGDLAFIADCPGAKLDPNVAHTGTAALALPAGAAGFTLKLPALVSPSNFPNAWTLVGGYFIAKQPTEVTVTYEVGGKALFRHTVALEPRHWTPVAADITALDDPNGHPSHDVGTVKFAVTGRDGVWCDDLFLLDNAKALVDDNGKSGDGWSIRRRGFATLVERPGSFKVVVPTPDADPSGGWRLQEASDLRAVFINGGGRVWAIYLDGREYLDGQFRSAVPLSSDRAADLARQHASPAEVTVPEELGRVERNAPGDANNDGYTETTGAYQLKANGPRLRVTIAPRTPKLIRPVLEIAGLPDGRVSANMEGQLVDRVARLPNGHVLMELPATLDRPVTVDVRVQ